MILDGLLDHLMQRGLEILSTFQTVGVNLQRLGNSGVQHHVGAGNGVGGAQHTELKLIAGESEGRCTVTIRGIPRESGKHIHTQFHGGLLSAGIGGVALNGIQNCHQLIAEKNGHNSGRSLVGTQTMIVARSGYGQP